MFKKNLNKMDQLTEINDVNIDHDNIIKSLEIYEKRLRSLIKKSNKLLNLSLKELIDKSEFSKKTKKSTNENNYEILEEVLIII